MTKAEIVFSKVAGMNWSSIGKEYVVPSLVIGPVVGAGITAATSKSKDEFKHNIVKGMGAGIAADAITGVAMGMWNQRKAATNAIKAVV